MSDSFWSKARGITPRPTEPPTRLGVPKVFTQPNQNLAVPPPAPASPQQQQLQQFYDQGYNDTHVPQWVKDQPTDLCPNCDGADYLIVQGHGHCWLCGYSSDRRMSDGQVGNAMSPRSNAPAQSTRQAHGMKNFGLATPNV